MALLLKLLHATLTKAKFEGLCVDLLDIFYVDNVIGTV